MIRFINPNYHVILIHYPLALLGLGLLIELFGFLWPAGSFRSAGRWMLLLGALAAVPAATSGIFAKYDVACHLAGGDEGNWLDLRAAANLTALQWTLLDRHVLLSAIGAALAALATVAWLASSPQWPSRPGPLVLAAFIAVMGLTTFGAYNAGELVYRTQFATDNQKHSDKLQKEWDAQLRTAAPADRQNQRIDYYVDPLQVHLIIAGVVFALAAGAMGTALKRSAQLRAKAPPSGPDKPAPPAPAALPVARLWAITVFAGALAAGIGWYVFARDLPTPLWHVRAIFDSEIWRPFQKDPHQNTRLLGHLVLGGSIIVLALLLIPAAHVAAGNRLLIVFLGLVMLAAIAGQIGVGVLMLYDTDNGPLTGFNTPSVAAGAPSAGAATALAGN